MRQNIVCRPPKVLVCCTTVSAERGHLMELPKGPPRCGRRGVIAPQHAAKYHPRGEITTWLGGTWHREDRQTGKEEAAGRVAPALLTVPATERALLAPLESSPAEGAAEGACARASVADTSASPLPPGPLMLTRAAFAGFPVGIFHPSTPSGGMETLRWEGGNLLRRSILR